MSTATLEQPAALAATITPDPAGPSITVWRADPPANALFGRTSIGIIVRPETPLPDRWQVSDRGYFRSLDGDAPTWQHPTRMPRRLRALWLVATATVEAGEAALTAPADGADA